MTNARKSFELGRGVLGGYLLVEQLKGRHHVVQALDSFSFLSQSLHGCETGDCRDPDPRPQRLHEGTVCHVPLVLSGQGTLGAR